MSITLIGYILIPIIIMCAFKMQIYDFILLAMFSSLFTATSIINLKIIDFNIGFQQFVALCLIIKFIYEYIIQKSIKIKISNKILFLFIAYACISIFIPLIFDKSSNLVIGVNSHMDFTPVKFSSSNVTQVIYLLLGYIVYIITYNSLTHSQMNKTQVIYKFNNTIIFSVVALSLLSIIQMIINPELFNYIFRHYNYNNQQVDFIGFAINRPSGPTGEPSFYTLLILPMVCYIVYNFKFYTNRIGMNKYYIILIISIIPLIASKSSSLIVGIALFICTLVIFNKDKVKKFNYKINKKINNMTAINKFVVIITSILVSIILVLIVINSDLMEQFISKIQGVGTSGSERTLALKQHLNVFKDNFIFGIGFGSLRSKDLISTWLAGMGLIGNGLFLTYIFKQIYELSKIGNELAIGLATIIIITWGILFISVPEPYYLCIWIYFAISEYILHDKKVY